MGLVFIASELSLDAPHSTAVFCGDSSTKGYALSETSATHHETSAACLFKERWRFKTQEVSFAEPQPFERRRTAPWLPPLERTPLLAALAGPHVATARSSARPSRLRVVTEDVEVVLRVPSWDPSWSNNERWVPVVKGAWSFHSPIHDKKPVLFSWGSDGRGAPPGDIQPVSRSGVRERPSKRLASVLSRAGLPPMS
eukprot:15040758-Heterocapsa_arctica.AAC.1